MKISIPPALARHCASAIAEWRHTADRHERVSRDFSESTVALGKAEHKLREVAGAIAMTIEALSAAAPAAAPAPAQPMPTTGDGDDAAHAILAWMQAGSPVDDNGNMLLPPPGQG